MAGNRITWLPSAEADAAQYNLQRAPTATGTWSDLATVAHDTGDAGVYDATSGRFFYVDATGSASDWYRLNVEDSLAQVSEWSAPFQVDVDPTAPVKYTTTDLVASIKRRAQIPDSQVTFSDAELLEMASEELEGTLVPLVMSAREDFFTTHVDYSTSAGRLYRVPPRAIGGVVRRVCYVDSEGDEVDLPRVSLDLLASAASGFVIRGNRILLVEDVPEHGTLRVYYPLAPGRLVGTDECAFVTSIDGTSVYTTGTPASFVASRRYDLVCTQPGFERLAVDQVITFNGDGSLSFSDGVPEDLAVGDAVCLAGESPVPQLPAEWHPLLAQAVAVKVLDSIGDQAGFATAESKLKQLVSAAMSLVANRVEGNPETVVPVLSPWRFR